MNLIGTLLLVACTTSGVEVRVEGPGLLRLAQSGRIVYAKQVQVVQKDGRLCTADGLPLIPTLSVSTEQDWTINADGNVRSQNRVIGRILLATFQEENHLKTTGSEFYISTRRPILRFPNTEGAGILVVGNKTQLLETTGPSTPSAGQSIRTITVRPKSEVTGKSFALGEIAEISAPEDVFTQVKFVVLGDTPALGTERIIDRSRILARLKSAGFQVDSSWRIVVPPNAKVSRKGNRISADEFVRIAHEAALKDLGLTEPLKATTSMPDMVIPLGAHTLRVESVTGNSQRASVVIAVFVDEVRFNSRTVQFVGSPQQILVRSGALVKIRIRSNGATVETQGRARTAGAAGQWVEVQTSLGVNLSGKVTKEGCVEVTL